MQAGCVYGSDEIRLNTTMGRPREPAQSLNGCCILSLSGGYWRTHRTISVAVAELLLRDTGKGLLDVVAAARPRVFVANGADCGAAHDGLL